MLFSIDREVLLENLNIIARGIPSKTPLNSLKGIKINVLDNQIIMTSSNTNISIQATINDKSLNVKSTGDVIVPGLFLIDIVRKVNSQKIEMALLEDRVFIIKANRSEFKLNIFDYEDYPEIKFIDDENPIKLESKALKNLIKETIFTCSTSEKRPILTGVNFKLDDGKLTCTATDSFRLSQKILYLQYNENKDVVIPASSLDDLVKIIENINGEINITIKDKNVLFKFFLATGANFTISSLFFNYLNSSICVPSTLTDSTSFVHNRMPRVLSPFSSKLCALKLSSKTFTRGFFS